MKQSSEELDCFRTARLATDYSGAEKTGPFKPTENTQNQRVGTGLSPR